MDSLLIFIIILLWFHGFIFLYLRKRNQKKLIKYLESFRGNELTLYEAKKLIELHTNFPFGSFEFYPNEQDYALLYKNQKFASFVKQNKKMTKYFIIVIPILFFSIILLDLLF